MQIKCFHCTRSVKIFEILNTFVCKSVAENYLCSTKLFYPIQHCNKASNKSHSNFENSHNIENVTYYLD